MKIIFDTIKGTCTVNRKKFESLNNLQKLTTVTHLRQFVRDNSKMTDYEEDCMWMSYRYCIGRNTIAAVCMASDIAKNCYGRMDEERSVFTSHDIDDQIMRVLSFGDVSFSFETKHDNIKATALDCWCMFLEKFKIYNNDDYLKYKSVRVSYGSDEDEIYFKAKTWDEWFSDEMARIIKENGLPEDITEAEFMKHDELPDVSNYISKKKMQSSRSVLQMNDSDSLLVWNQLCHLFNYKTHHKSILKDGTECEWYWTYRHNFRTNDDGTIDRLRFEKVKVPVSSPIGSCMLTIPEESIKSNLY